jgi:hypothetical protein
MLPLLFTTWESCGSMPSDRCRDWTATMADTFPYAIPSPMPPLLACSWSAMLRDTSTSPSSDFAATAATLPKDAES